MNDDLRSAYAVVALPESVRLDMRTFCFINKTTCAWDDQRRIDHDQMLINEGMRVAWQQFETNILTARLPKPERQEKAVSETAETEP